MNFDLLSRCIAVSKNTCLLSKS